MLKTFYKGLVFGSGFVIAVFILGIGMLKLYENTFKYDVEKINSELASWHELDNPQQIQQARAMVILRYRDGDDGRKVAYIERIFKRGDVDNFVYEKNELYPDADYFPRKNGMNRSGAVLMFNKSSNIAASTWFIYDERVSALGDMPLELLIEKYEDGT